MKFKCKVCGYIHEGDSAPEICPKCKMKDVFEPLEEAPSNPYAGTQTEKNLATAFAGESEARNKYTYYSSVAKKEGYEQIAALFLKTAENEKEHAKLWYKNCTAVQAQRRRIWPLPQMAKIMNGQICTQDLRIRPMRKDSMSWQKSSAALLQLKSITKNVIAHC